MEWHYLITLSFILLILNSIAIADDNAIPPLDSPTIEITTTIKETTTTFFDEESSEASYGSSFESSSSSQESSSIESSSSSESSSLVTTTTLFPYEVVTKDKIIYYRLSKNDYTLTVQNSTVCGGICTFYFEITGNAPATFLNFKTDLHYPITIVNNAATADTQKGYFTFIPHNTNGEFYAILESKATAKNILEIEPYYGVPCNANLAASGCSLVLNENDCNVAYELTTEEFNCYWDTICLSGAVCDTPSEVTSSSESSSSSTSSSSSVKSSSSSSTSSSRKSSTSMRASSTSSSSSSLESSSSQESSSIESSSSESSSSSQESSSSSSSLAIIRCNTFLNTNPTTTTLINPCNQYLITNES